jgi:hypothetical protein
MQHNGGLVWPGADQTVWILCVCVFVCFFVRVSLATLRIDLARLASGSGAFCVASCVCVFVSLCVCVFKHSLGTCVALCLDLCVCMCVFMT